MSFHPDPDDRDILEQLWVAFIAAGISLLIGTLIRALAS